MSLSRQLVALLGALFVAVFVGSFALAVHGTRGYLSAQLASHAQDTATFLGLALTTRGASDDPLIAQSMVDALFDRGDYRRIEVVDRDGAALVARELAVRVAGVPGWFVSVLPLATPTGEAALMAGWAQRGTVRVQSHPGHAYRELWRSAGAILGWCALTFAVALAVGIVGVSAVLRPLRAVERQARAITERRFPVVGELPRAPELRTMVSAMNRMTTKVSEMLDEQSRRADALRAQALADPVTGIANRRALDEQLEALAVQPEGSGPGLLAFVHLGGLRERLARDGVAARDRVLADLAARALGFAERHGASAARVGDADLALLATAVDGVDARAFGAALVDALALGADAPGIEVQVGIATFHRAQSVGALRAAADLALRTAQGRSGHAFEVMVCGPTDPLAALGADGWRRLLVSHLERGAIALVAQPVRAAAGDALLHHEVLARLPLDDGRMLAGARFVGMAERLGLGARLDRLVVARVLDALEAADTAVVLAVNLGAGSLLAPDRDHWLDSAVAPRLRQLGRPDAPAGRGARLVVEVSERDARAHGPATERLAERLRGAGGELALDHFGHGARAIALLRLLRPAYVKLDPVFTAGLAADGDTAFAITAVAGIARGLDVAVIAQAVETESARRGAVAAGVDGLQGHHVAPPGPLDPDGRGELGR
ncbi:MAG: EAL domain-containing protein [Chromatiales bacterium]|nr:EAL domain-containing protein [Chromatiales bacterium]